MPSSKNPSSKNPSRDLGDSAPRVNPQRQALMQSFSITTLPTVSYSRTLDHLKSYAMLTFGCRETSGP